MVSFQRFYKAWANEILGKAYTTARKKNLTVWFKNESLYFRHERYTWKNFISIPAQINPAYIYTPRSDSMVVFFYSYSPLSNHYLSPFTIAGETFNCAEQYLMWRKARLFNDNKIASLILCEPNPVKQKHLGRQVRGFNNDVWRREAPMVLLKGLRAKFEQNPDCASFLMQTGLRHIVEASQFDKIYGVGINVFDQAIWDVSKHCGKNLLGLTLEKVRNTIYVPGIRAPSDNGTRLERVIMSGSMHKFSIGDRKTATVTEFNGDSYVHFQDKQKEFRKISFNSTEFAQLMKKRDDIKSALSEALKKAKRKKSKKSKKSKDSDDESEVNTSSWEEEDEESAEDSAEESDCEPPKKKKKKSRKD